MTYRKCCYCDSRMPKTVMFEDGRDYCCRSELACFNRLLAKYRGLLRIKNIGAQMANACFNIGQGINLHPDDHKSLDDLCRQWDEALRAVKS